MEEKRKDLQAVRQREIIEAVMASLAASHPDFYYMPTIELAAEIKNHIHTPGNLSHEDMQVVEHLKRRDIQLILGLHSQHD